MTHAGKTGSPAAFHVLVKPTGAVCNLDCSYCFYLSKEMLYPGSRFRMADETLRLYLRQLIEAHRSPEVTISWQGGEPLLMGRDFFRRAVAHAESWCRPGMRLAYTMQTNGTLIDDDWCAFFKQHGFLVGISVDGPQAMHDAYRRGRNGQPSFARVMRGLSLLRKHGVDFNTLTCIHRANAEHPLEVYRFLRDDCGSTHLQLIPVVERVRGVAVPLPRTGAGDAAAAPATPWRQRPLHLQESAFVTDRSVRPQQYGEFLIGVFDEWVRHDVGRVFIQMFESALANWMQVPAGMCVHSARCGTAVALEHNGDLYSCDHFVEPQHRLGNIAEHGLAELVGSSRQRKFGADKLDTLPRTCRRCEVRFACHGGCPKDRFVRAQDGEPGLNYLCDGYKAFFGHVDGPMCAMRELLRLGRAPEQVMRYYREARAAEHPVD